MPTPAEIAAGVKALHERRERTSIALAPEPSREEEVRIVLEAAEAARPVVWHPIETAPNNGTDVLLLLRSEERGHRVWIARQNRHGDWTPHVECAEDLGFYMEDAATIGATHWMPLPALPLTLPFAKIRDVQDK
jgi:hypothetical protein